MYGANTIIPTIIAIAAKIIAGKEKLFRHFIHSQESVK